MNDTITKFTEEQHDSVLSALGESTYLNERPRFRKKKVTNILCPICGEPLILNICGNSFEMKCNSDGIVLSMRGL
jgi:hypothetical protein